MLLSSKPPPFFLPFLPLALRCGDCSSGTSRRTSSTRDERSCSSGAESEKKKKPM
jgi:hypothetical protein